MSGMAAAGGGYESSRTEFFDADLDRAESVLRMALVRNQRAIDRVLDYLAAGGPSPTGEGAAPGGDVFGELIGGARWPGGVVRMEDVVVGGVSLETLGRLKQAGKQMARSSLDEEGRMAGSGVYALAVASALAHHGEVISSAGRGDLRTLLADFAELTGEPWRGVFGRAADRLRAGEGADEER